MEYFVFDTKKIQTYVEKYKFPRLSSKELFKFAILVLVSEKRNS